MKQTRILMGMPVTVEIVDDSPASIVEATINQVYEYFTHIDETFSTYKTTSEISAINSGALSVENASEEMRLVFLLSEETKNATRGYFDIKRADGVIDPSGLVKGWAIWNATQLIAKKGFANFYVDAGGDIQTHGKNAEGISWTVGIKNPWDEKENVKVLSIQNEGVATSGTYIRGHHIYNPRTGEAVNEIVSLTVVGPNIYEADRFATAAFAMGAQAIQFIESLDGLEGYMIDSNKVATLTSGFERYTVSQ